METVELKKWINYLVFLMFTTLLFFLNILGVFSSLYSLNMAVFRPLVDNVRDFSLSFVGGVESFWATRRLKQENLRLSKLLLEKEDKIIELETTLNKCQDLANQVKLSQKKNLGKLHQGAILNRYYQPNGMMLVDFGSFAINQKLEGTYVFYKHFWVGEVVRQQNNLLTVKTLWNSDLRKKIYLHDAKIVGLLVYENNEFKIKDILVKENVKVGDIAYLPGNACVERLIVGKVTAKESFLGSPKEVLKLDPIMDLSEINYVYICK